MSKTLKIAGGALLVVLFLIQFIRPERANPPEDPAESIYAHVPVPTNVQSMVERSCFDCHSNWTRWPWYSHVAPFSWILAGDVREGRSHLNFSTWGRYRPKHAAGLLGRIATEVEEGEMPMKGYLLLHPKASLTAEQKDTLCNWAAAVSNGIE